MRFPKADGLVFPLWLGPLLGGYASPLACCSWLLHRLVPSMVSERFCTKALITLGFDFLLLGNQHLCQFTLFLTASERILTLVLGFQLGVFLRLLRIAHTDKAVCCPRCCPFRLASILSCRPCRQSRYQRSAVLLFCFVFALDDRRSFRLPPWLQASFRLDLFRFLLAWQG